MTAPAFENNQTAVDTKEALSQFHSDFGKNLPTTNIDFAAIMAPDKAGESSPPSAGAKTTAEITAAGVSAADRLSLEGQLLGSIPANIGHGIANSARDAWEHLGRTSFETVSGLALGAGFVLLCKNPRPAVVAATTWAGRAFLGIAAYDLGSRFARPMADTWMHPEHLQENKKVLGDNVGDAVFNYTLAIAGGIGGASLGEKYLATTRLGTVLQGFKESEISAQALGKLVLDPALADHPQVAMAQAFSRSGLDLDGLTSGAKSENTTASTLPLSGKIRLRTMADGSQIGSAADGSVMVLTGDGAALWFKNNRSLFGLRNKLDLAKVLHPGGEETDVLSGLYNPTTVPKYGKGGPISGLSDSKSGGVYRGDGQFIGRDPAAYFDPAPGEGGSGATSGKVEELGKQPNTTYSTKDGIKFVTGDQGALTSVQSGANRVFLDAKGQWKLGLANLGTAPSDFMGIDLDPANLNLAAINNKLEMAKKGAEVGLTEIMLERGGDIGSSVFEHEVLLHTSKEASDNTP